MTIEIVFHVWATVLLGMSALFWNAHGALNFAIRLMMLFAALLGCVLIAAAILSAFVACLGN